MESSDLATISAHLRQMEERLLRPEVRRDTREVASLLTEDFREFGSSGRRFSRPEILQALAIEESRRLSLQDFHCELLAPNVALVTYRSSSALGSEEPVEALRSSVWVQRAGKWQLLFHQGTRITPPAA